LEVDMTKILLAALLAGALAACAQNTVQPPAAADVPAVNSLTSGFEPYCGPVWLVGRQGYVIIPCPPGSGYASGLR
jgi:hypothetical protein